MPAGARLTHSLLDSPCRDTIADQQNLGLIWVVLAPQVDLVLMLGDLCDQMAVQFRQIWKNLDISYDAFIRTTEERHAEAVDLAAGATAGAVLLSAAAAEPPPNQLTAQEKAEGWEGDEPGAYVDLHELDGVHVALVDVEQPSRLVGELGIGLVVIDLSLMEPPDILHNHF